jgi:hypothetical protein
VARYGNKRLLEAEPRGTLLLELPAPRALLSRKNMQLFSLKNALVVPSMYHEEKGILCTLNISKNEMLASFFECMPLVYDLLHSRSVLANTLEKVV